MPGTTKPSNPRLAAVPDVDIDPQGKFKYILIEVWDPGDKTSTKYVVRGYRRAGFHADVFDEVEPSLEALGLECLCKGGGRILHEPDKRSIHVYGYSQGFGKADHQITTDVLKKHFHQYTNITWSDEGY